MQFGVHWPVLNQLKSWEWPAGDSKIHSIFIVIDIKQPNQWLFVLLHIIDGTTLSDGTKTLKDGSGASSGQSYGQERWQRTKGSRRDGFVLASFRPHRERKIELCKVEGNCCDGLVLAGSQNFFGSCDGN